MSDRSYSPGSAWRRARTVSEAPSLGSTVKLPATLTTPPGEQWSYSSSTRSRTTASTAPVTSPSTSFRNPSPFFLCRRARSRTRKKLSTGWPSTRSRTNDFAALRHCCSIDDSTVERVPDGTCALRCRPMASEKPTVLVAGGTGALGAAVLAELLAAGHPLTATWIMEEERERVERDFEGRPGLTLVKADLMDPEAASEAVGGVDNLGAVVNLVGGFSSPRRGPEAEIADFESQLRPHLRPGFLLARPAMPRMIANGGGAFVGVSARPALRPFSGAAGYITAKAGVLAFIQALDAEYRNDGVRANAILPSVIDTPANRRAQPDADHSKWVPPQQIAKVVRFLVSDDSAPTSGAAIPVYGRA